jgi:hypothetical protein
MSDDEFVEAFETCTLPKELFHHRDHLRLAWIYLRRYGRREAGTRVGESIRRYAAHLGASQKYHETITLAWFLLMEHAHRQAKPGASFEDVLAAFPELVDQRTPQRYYSSAVLQSDAARTAFVEPDLAPLPRMAF